MNIKLVSLQWAKVVLVHPLPETVAQRVDMSQDGGLHRDISQVRYLALTPMGEKQFSVRRFGAKNLSKT